MRAETVVTAPASSQLAALTSGKGGDVTLRDLRIEGELIGAHASGGPLTLRGVWVESVRRFGLLSTGPALDAEDVLVRGTRAMTDGTAGRGLYVYGKGKASARRSTFEENRKVGVSVTDAGSSIELIDVVVRRTREEESSKDLGDGIEATVGGKLVATRLLVEDNLTYGIGCFNAGSSVSLTDVTVRRTEARVKDQKWGVGLMVQESASADLVRVTLDDNRTDGVFGADKATITGTDVVVRRTRAELSSQSGGLGLRAELGSKLTLTRTLLDKNREAGVLALSTGSAIVLDHVLVLRTEEGSMGVSPGLAAEQGARIEARHAIVYESHSEGAYAANAGSSLVLEDAAILRTQLSSNAPEAAGLAVALDGAVEARRVLIEESLAVGVAVGGGALTLEDAVVRKGVGTDAPSVFGGGLFVQGAGKLTASRVLVAENHTFAVAVRDLGSTVDLSDVVVADTVRQTISDFFGEGMLVQKQGAITGHRVFVWRSQEEGVLVDSGAAVLEDLTVLETGPDKKGDFGEAIEGVYGAQIAVTRGRVGACRGAGVILIDPGTKGTLRDLLVEKVSVDGAGERGYGVGAFSGATLDLSNARVEDVTVAGVWGFAATLALDRVDVRRVTGGKGTVIDAKGNPVGEPLTGLADGLLATSNASVTVSKMSVSSVARAGILFNASKGSIANVVASDNAYGLVLQGDPRPTVDASSAFTNNREKDRLDDAGLSVPNRPPAKPTAPP